MKQWKVTIIVDDEPTSRKPQAEPNYEQIMAAFESEMVGKSVELPSFEIGGVVTISEVIDVDEYKPIRRKR